MTSKNDKNKVEKDFPPGFVPFVKGGGKGKKKDDKKSASDYIEGLNMLSNMKLCSNVPGQWAIQPALSAGGRWHQQRGAHHAARNG